MAVAGDQVTIVWTEPGEVTVEPGETIDLEVVLQSVARTTPASRPAFDRDRVPRVSDRLLERSNVGYPIGRPSEHSSNPEGNAF